MGLLDGIIGKLAEGRQDQMIGSLTGLLDQVGGLDGLVQKFQASGLGDQVGSWVGLGDNQEVSAAQVTDALGADNVARVAAETGVSQEQAASGLAKFLPEIVNQLTPDGKLPAADQLQGLIGNLDVGKIMGMLR